MQVPRLDKIVVNIGLGRGAAPTPRRSTRRSATWPRSPGQKPIVTKAKRSIAQFRLRTGNTIGAKVTLRGERMWDFLERLTVLALPRIRDFRGVPAKSFDGRGNYSPRAARAARVPRDRLRQGRPSPRAGDQHRDDGEDRRGVQAACSSSSACPSPARRGEEDHGQEIADRQGEANAQAQGRRRTTAATCAAGRAPTCAALRSAASASASAPCWASCPGVTKSSW